MIPSKTWFPLSLQERAAWFQNFIANFTPIASGLGFTPAEVAAIGQDNEDFQSIAVTTVALDSFGSAVRQYRISLTEDPVGTPQPVFPSESFSGPPNDRPAGVFQRLVETVERIRASPAYTDETGAALGIIPSPSPGQQSLENESPVLKIKTQPGNLLEIGFVRGKSDGIVAEIQIDNSNDWTAAGTFLKSPGSVAIPANPENLPRAVRVRARFLDGNNPIGNYSDTVNVVTTP